MGRMPGLKPKADQKPGQAPRNQARSQSGHGFAQPGAQATTRLSGGWTQRTREVIDLPQVPVQVTEHVYMARTAPSANSAVYRRRNWRVWCWESSVWGSTWSA